MQRRPKALINKNPSERHPSPKLRGMEVNQAQPIPSLSQLSHGVGLAACYSELPKDGGDKYRLQVLPAGKFKPNLPRPVSKAGHWYMDGEIAKKIISESASKTNKLVVDYEHQTLNAPKNGRPAPAAGWFESYEWVEGDGLYAVISLTAEAQSYVQNDQYRYFSPVFLHDKNTGHVTRLLMGALTNNPGLDNLQPLELMQAACAQFDLEANTTDETAKETNDMSKELLAALCGMLGVATEGRDDAAIQGDAKAAIDALKAQSQETQALSATPNPEEWAPVADLKAVQDQLAALTASHNAEKVEAAVSKALEQGRLLPTQEAWARNLGAQNLIALTQFLDTAPPLANALTQSQTGGQAPEGNPAHGLSQNQLAVCTAMGLSPEEYATTMSNDPLSQIEEEDS